MNKGQEKMVEILKNNRVLEALKREFDRSFAIKISEADNKIKIEFEEKDTGLPVMTVGDVAAFLQTDRASVRRMTGDRAQHRSHHPLPFVKVGGKMIRFSRPAIEAWWSELCASKNGKSNASALALFPEVSPERTALEVAEKSTLLHFGAVVYAKEVLVRRIVNWHAISSIGVISPSLTMSAVSPPML